MVVRVVASVQCCDWCFELLQAAVDEVVGSSKLAQVQCVSPLLTEWVGWALGWVVSFYVGRVVCVMLAGSCCGLLVVGHVALC